MDAERREKRSNDKILKKTHAHPKAERFLRAEQIVKYYRQKEAQVVRMQRISKIGKFLPPNPDVNLILVVRIRGKHGITPRIKKILALLRLKFSHTASFLQLDPNIQHMLRLVEPFVTYGYPNLKTVRDLVTKRGYTRLAGKRQALTDNVMIENELGNVNVVCIEDIVHEIYTCGPAFKKVNKFLYPFKLNVPHGGFPNKRTTFAEGGDAGNRHEKINQLVQLMN